MLKVILNRLKPKAEEVIAEENAGFSAGRSTTEHIFNLRILCEKYRQHQQNFVSCLHRFQKKAFYRVLHTACGPPWRNTISMQTKFALFCSSTTRLQVHLRLMIAQENGSEQQLELGKDVFFHPHSSTFFSKRYVGLQTEWLYHPKPYLRVTRAVGDWHPFRVVLGWAYRGLTGGFLLHQNFSVAISVSPHVCFILVLNLISVFLR